MGENNKKENKKSENKASIIFNKIKKFINSTLFGLIISVIHIVVTCFLLAEILYLNMLPVKIFVPVCLLVLVLCAVAFLMAFAGKKVRAVGKLISLLMVAVSVVGIYYISKVNNAIDGIAGSNTKTDVVNVYVMKADKAKDINDAKDYTFGIMGVLDRTNTDKTIASVEKEVGQKIATEEYEGYLQLVDALYDGEVEAIILNEAYISQITDDEAYASFETVTKVLHNESHETQLDVDTDKELNDNVFTMYLSGIDVRGKITNTSRSDVNVIAVINPDTRQVLLLNTPRDYYVPLSISNGIEDKLTHAGIYGVDVSMETLEMLYDMELDYYFRVNFTGFEDVIDALGGIDIYSDYAFTTTHGGYRIKKGMNSLNGKQALGFARERYSLPSGDNQRGKNHMAIIEAVINKAASSSILNDFTGLMESLEGSFQTSMSSTQISSLVRMQLEEGGSWNVVNYAVEGTGASMHVYSMSSKVYVTIPDYTTVGIAKKLIQMVYDGETLSDEIIDELVEKSTETEDSNSGKNNTSDKTSSDNDNDDDN